MKNKTRLITRTAVLLALTVVFQYTGRLIPLGSNSNFIVGPLVNACLLVAVATTGIWGATLIAVIAPLVAALTIHTPVAPYILVFSPFIAAGNFVLVLLFYLFRKKNKILGIASGAILKFLILFGGISLILSIKDAPPAMAAALSFLFGWSQLVTAAAGGIVAMIILRVIGEKYDIDN